MIVTPQTSHVSPVRLSAHRSVFAPASMNVVPLSVIDIPFSGSVMFCPGLFRVGKAQKPEKERVLL